VSGFSGDQSTASSESSEVVMTTTVDRQAQHIRLILVVLGAVLTIVGWARFAGL
jgi:hypothetical protein